MNEPQMNGAAPEDLDMIRMKAFVYDCADQEELWRRRREEVNAEIARRKAAAAQKATAQPPPQLPTETEPAEPAAVVE